MKKIVIIISGLVLSLFLASSAMAMGFGAFGTVGGSRNFSPDSWAINGGGGLMVDTNVAKKDMFAYRFAMAAEAWNENWKVKQYEGGLLERTANASVTAFKFNMTHTFGFAVKTTSKYKIWVGPQVHMGVYFYDGFAGSAAGLGFAGGVNKHLSNTLTLTVDGAIRGGWLMRGTGGSYWHGGNVSMHFNVGIMFRVAGDKA